jgi:hypothetical protein
MSFQDDNPGIFTFLVGVIVLVMAGIGLSLLVDRRFADSETVTATKEAIQAGAEEIERLEFFLHRGTRELAGAEPARRTLVVSLASARRDLENLSKRRETLQRSRDQLRSAVATIGRESANYRGKYREFARAAAIGQSLGTLQIRGGREYHQAVITRVTEVGLEIRHEHGMARVQAPDLGAALQDRFQWNEEERRARLMEEAAHHAAVGDSASKPRKPEPTAMARELPDDRKLESLRAKVRAWQSKVAHIEARKNEAESSASYGAQSSVPGSLDTWQARTARLETERSKARAELAVARAELARVSPQDLLLRPEN